MDSKVSLLRHLKQHGPSSIDELMAALGLSENAVRHHLKHLRQEGFLEEHDESIGVGRPVKRYSLTLAAEGFFPKRYQELLDMVLAQAEKQGTLDALMNDIANDLAAQLKPELGKLPPKERLLKLMEKLDYGEMLGRLESTPGGWEFKAYNCVYRDSGCKFLPICNFLPNVIQTTTALPAERVICQRDGERFCQFAGSYHSPNNS
jgi:predicted ArsR family transcriptional regulator